MAAATQRRSAPRGVVPAVAGAAVAAGLLAAALAGKRDEFTTALGAAPLWLLPLAAALQSSRSCRAARPGTLRRARRAATVAPPPAVSAPRARQPRQAGQRAARRGRADRGAAPLRARRDAARSRR